MKINIFWFRRDLRLDDNTGLLKALNTGLPVLPLFIFDNEITDELPPDDPRISFIYNKLHDINEEIRKWGATLLIKKGNPLKVVEKLVSQYDINAFYINKDYEPYALKRDDQLEALLMSKDIRLFRFKDQVIFGENDVVKTDGKPYNVYTPYRNSWIRRYKETPSSTTAGTGFNNNAFLNSDLQFPGIEELGFRKSKVHARPFNLSRIKEYDRYRDIPAFDRTTYLSPHLRFGTVSIRKLVRKAYDENMVFLNELIWREFFMQILYHYPDVVTGNFKAAYDDIEWINDDGDFERWCNGETGYHLVDAGMRQLNETGYMHNRVRMICAGFLCKHLLTDWRRGEAYFAKKLLDYELSSNNGNWQWAAGTGCDAAPYFRVFNPEAQQKKFDPHFEYILKWVPEFGKPGYPDRIIDHDFARQRAIDTYKKSIKRNFQEL